MNKILAFISIIIIIACNNNASKPHNAKEHAHEAKETGLDSTSAMATHVNKRYTTNDVLHSYFVFAESLVLAKDSLTSIAYEAFNKEVDKAITAKTNTNALSLLQKVKAELGGNPKAVNQWQVDINTLRAKLNTIQPHIYALSKILKDNDKPLYKQFCPMAFKNKGASWMSTDSIIRNPYFGDEMLDCGSVDEVVN
jgi:hypothetical protein